MTHSFHSITGTYECRVQSQLLKDLPPQIKQFKTKDNSHLVHSLTPQQFCLTKMDTMCIVHVEHIRILGPVKKTYVSTTDTS